MRFGIEMWDTFFSFSDPKMAIASVYGFIWLLLATILLVSRSREIRLPSIFSLLIFIPGGLFFVTHSAVMALINVFLPYNVYLGMFGGGPPLWLSASGMTSGLLIGWAISGWRRKISAQWAVTDSGLKGRWDRKGTAFVLSLLFPGLGQIYYGRYSGGLIGFVFLCLFSSIFRVWAFIVVYLVIQVATIKDGALGRFFKALKRSHS